MKRDDILWKALLEDIFDDFLRFFFENADEIFDMNRGFEFLDKELEQLFPPENDNFEPRYVDKLVKVFTKTHEEKWFLVHIEVQGYEEQGFEKRMFQYYYRILDKYDKPITSFAILTDANKNFYPTEFRNEFLGTYVKFGFNTYKVLTQNEDDLLNSNNPFAIIILTTKIALQKKKVSKIQLFDLKVALARKLLGKNISKEKIRVLMNFLRYYVRFENKELDANFENIIEVITEKRKTMGIEQFLLYRAEQTGMNKGMEKGMEKGMGIKELEKNTLFVKSLLNETDFDNKKIANLTGVSESFVNKIKKEMKNN